MERTIHLLDAIPYVRAYSGQTFVVKVGGDLLRSAKWRDGIARDLSALHRLRIRVVKRFALQPTSTALVFLPLALLLRVLPP